jgi:hypothetical protein
MEQGVYLLEDDFFFELVQLTNIRLLLKIWLLIKEYASQLNVSREINNIEPYKKLINAILDEDLLLSLHLYEQIRKL